MTEVRDIDDLVTDCIHILVNLVNQDEEKLEAQKITTVAHLIADLNSSHSIDCFLNLVEQAVYAIKNL